MATIFVGGLPDALDDVKLKGLFQTFGDIKSVQIPRDQETGRTKGFAFIEYELKEDAKEAIENYDQTEIYGKVIKVKKADNQKNIYQSKKAIWDQEQKQILDNDQVQVDSANEEQILV